MIRPILRKAEEESCCFRASSSFNQVQIGRIDGGGDGGGEDCVTFFHFKRKKGEAVTRLFVVEICDELISEIKKKKTMQTQNGRRRRRRRLIHPLFFS